MLRPRVSRFFQRFDEVTSRVGTAATVAGVLVAFMIVLTFAGFPTNWQLGFSTTSNAIA